MRLIDLLVRCMAKDRIEVLCVTKHLKIHRIFNLAEVILGMNIPSVLGGEITRIAVIDDRTLRVMVNEVGLVEAKLCT